MAFNTRGQNSPPSYLDGISVKISEKYKPPKKINVALSYSQILTLNKLIQDPYPNYDFTLEESIKSRVNEWRKVRSTLAEERKQRLQILSQERNTKNWKQQPQQQSENSGNDVNEVLAKSNSDNDTISTSDISNNKDTEVSTTATTTTTTSHFYTTESGVLIPMTSQQQQQQQQQSNLNRPVYQIEHFNFSEFESDTSSPFDNMELKTINDLEELAEVLKRDSDINSSPIINNTIINDHQSTNVIENNYINSSSVVNTNTDNMYDNAYAYKPITNSKECHINGYYYNHHTPIYTSKVMYGHDALASHIGNDLKHAQAHGSPIRSVTEIMKSLHEQFAANHITENSTPKQLGDMASSSSKRNPQNTVVTKKTSEDLLDNPYNSLSPDLQKMAVTISNMGFPLSRVARACQALDGNQKKIVEHLLAMSELLDLGFSEENVVSALLKCDNDRDKALDILIT